VHKAVNGRRRQHGQRGNQPCSPERPRVVAREKVVNKESFGSRQHEMPKRKNLIVRDPQQFYRQQEMVRLVKFVCGSGDDQC